MEEESENQYELVFPFVLTDSEGGPFDDHSFVAGFSIGRIHALMENEADIEEVIKPNLFNQVDLMAMAYGYIVHMEMLDDEWAMLTGQKTSF